jgi:hypothetical protein
MRSMTYEHAIFRATQKSPHSDLNWKAIRFAFSLSVPVRLYGLRVKTIRLLCTFPRRSREHDGEFSLDKAVGFSGRLHG